MQSTSILSVLIISALFSSAKAVSGGTTPFIAANGVFQNVPFSGVGNDTLYGTNFGPCTGSLTIGIPPCTGFWLNIYDDDNNLIGTTPTPVSAPECPYNVTDPTDLPSYVDYVNTTFIINESGPQVFEFNTLNGTAGTYLALKFDTAPGCNLNTCTNGSSQFVVLNGQTTFANAASACASFGYTLASMTNANFLEATSVLFNCVGAGSSGWINDWYGNTYNGVPLTLDCGWQTPGGAITVPASLDALYSPICIVNNLQSLYYL